MTSLASDNTHGRIREKAFMSFGKAEIMSFLFYGVFVRGKNHRGGRKRLGKVDTEKKIWKKFLYEAQLN